MACPHISASTNEKADKNKGVPVYLIKAYREILHLAGS